MQLPTTPIAREAIPRHLLCPLADRSEHQQGQGDQRDERKTEIQTEPGSYECGGKYCTFQCKSMWELEFHMEVGCGVWDSDEEQQLPVAQPQKPDDVQDQKPDMEDTMPDVSVKERCGNDNTADVKVQLPTTPIAREAIPRHLLCPLADHMEVGCGVWDSDEEQQLPVAQPQKPDDVKDQKPDDVKDQKPDVEDTKPDVSVNERCDKENTAQTEPRTYECVGKYCTFQCKSQWELDFHTEVGCGAWYSDEKMPISPRDFGR